MVDCEQTSKLLALLPRLEGERGARVQLTRAGRGGGGGRGGVVQLWGGKLLLHRFGAGGVRLLLRDEHYDEYNYPPLTLSFSYCPAMAFLKGLGMMMLGIMSMALVSFHTC